MRSSRDLTSKPGAASRTAAPRLTKAGAWYDARKRGQRLPEHALPGDADMESAIYTQTLEKMP